MKNCILLIAISVSALLTPGYGDPIQPPTAPTGSGQVANNGGPANKTNSLSLLIGQTLDKFEKRLARPDGGLPDSRDLTNGALASLTLGRDPQLARKLLSQAFAAQDMDATSLTYGSFPWQIGRPEVQDQNADEFASQALGPIWSGYAALLGRPFIEANVSHLKAAIVALKRRQFRDPSYTNIFLMRATNLILIGEAIGDSDAARYGYAELDAFRLYTATNGIHEFDSNTYYATDLNSLYMGARFARNPQPFRDILDTFWRDIAANFFPGSGALSGPQSRDYNFLTSAGGIDYYLWAAGLKVELDRAASDLEKSYVLVALSPAGKLEPSPQFAQLTVPRMVSSLWGPHSGQDRTNYVDKHSAIGCASADYNSQDKPISIELEDADADISVVPDATDQPYGKTKTRDSSGHDKPTHLPLHPVCVQDRGLILATLDLDPHKVGPLESLATNVLLPANAAVTVDGNPVDISMPFEQKLTTKSVVTVSTATATAVIRVVAVDSAGGFTPSMLLTADQEALMYGVLRIAAYAYKGPRTTLTETHSHVVLLLLECNGSSPTDVAMAISELRGAQVMDNDAAGQWNVTAAVGARNLALIRDSKSREVISRSTDGHAWKAPDGAFEVDETP